MGAVGNGAIVNSGLISVVDVLGIILAGYLRQNIGNPSLSGVSVGILLLSMQFLESDVFTCLEPREPPVAGVEICSTASRTLKLSLGVSGRWLECLVVVQPETIPLVHRRVARFSRISFVFGQDCRTIQNLL